MGEGLRPQQSGGWAGPPGLREWAGSLMGEQRLGWPPLWATLHGQVHAQGLSQGSCRAFLLREWLSSSVWPLLGWHGPGETSAVSGGSNLSLSDVPELQGMLPARVMELPPLVCMGVKRIGSLVKKVRDGTTGVPSLSDHPDFVLLELIPMK